MTPAAQLLRHESAQSSGGDNAYFIEQMASWIATHNVASANYWQYGPSQLFGGNTSNASAAFIASFGSHSTFVVGGAANSTSVPTSASVATPPRRSVVGTIVSSVQNAQHILSYLFENFAEVIRNNS